MGTHAIVNAFLIIINVSMGDGVFIQRDKMMNEQTTLKQFLGRPFEHYNKPIEHKTIFQLH